MMTKYIIPLLILLLSFSVEAKPLKATKDKILFSQAYDKKELNPKTGEWIEYGMYVTYDYISDKEVEDKDHFDNETGKKIKEDKTKRTSNSRHYLLKSEKIGRKIFKTWVGYFWTGQPFFYDDKVGKWYRIETDEMPEQEWLDVTAQAWWEVGEAYATNYYSGNGDGYTLASDATWSVAHDNEPAGFARDTATTEYVEVLRIEFVYYIARLFLPFNTNTLPAGATIDSTVLNIYVNTSSGTTAYYYVVETSQPDETNVTVNDHTNIGTTSAGTTIAYGTGWQSSTFDATGMGFVKRSGDASTCGTGLTGWTCLGITHKYDHDNTYSSGTYAGYDLVRVSEYADVTSDPYLTVTYTEGGAARRVMIIQ